MIKELKVGDIVLIEWDKKKRIDWLLERIIAIFPGQDNFIQVKVKTSNGELTQPNRNIQSIVIETYCELKDSVNNVNHLKNALLFFTLKVVNLQARNVFIHGFY